MPIIRVIITYRGEIAWFWHLALDLVDGLGKASNVLASDTGDGNTSILGSIDGVLSTISVCSVYRSAQAQALRMK